ncbi:MAG: alpha/beta hydrolase [Polyangiaceae bacterium]
MAQAQPNKSTNVRNSNWQLGAIRAGLRVVGPTAPRLAARWIEPLFFRVPHFPRPAWEVSVLERASAKYIVPSQGKNLPVWTWGEGPVVLLVHGWAGRGSQLGAFVEPLVEAGFRVATFDGPGHGENTERSCSIPELATAITDVARSLGALHGIVAHSMGAASSLLAASRGLEVDRLTLVSPPASPTRFAHEFASKLGLSASVKEALKDRVEARLRVSFAQLESHAIVPRVHAPLLIIHDETDRDVPIDDGRRIAELAQRARLVTTQGLGHRKILRDPSVIQQTVGFLKKEARVPGKPTSSPRWTVSPLDAVPPTLSALL